MPEIVQTTGLCKATFYNKINDGSFPKQIPIVSNIVVWLESEIKEWMDNQIKMSR